MESVLARESSSWMKRWVRKGFLAGRSPARRPSPGYGSTPQRVTASGWPSSTGEADGPSSPRSPARAAPRAVPRRWDGSRRWPGSAAEAADPDHERSAWRWPAEARVDRTHVEAKPPTDGTAWPEEIRSGVSRPSSSLAMRSAQDGPRRPLRGRSCSVTRLATSAPQFAWALAMQGSPFRASLVPAIELAVLLPAAGEATDRPAVDLPALATPADPEIASAPPAPVQHQRYPRSIRHARRDPGSTRASVSGRPQASRP